MKTVIIQFSAVLFLMSAATASAQSVTVGNGYNNSGSVTLNSLSPSSGQAGTQIVLFGSGFTAYDNVVHFGIGGQRAGQPGALLPIFEGTGLAR